MAKRSYFLTPSAVADIRDIGDWSMERWGKARTRQYLTDLHTGLEFVAANFMSLQNNKTAEELSGGTGLLLYPIHKHYVVYVPIGATSIAVAAIIRQGRDIPSLLQKDGFMIRRQLQDISEGIAEGRIVPIATP